MAIRKIVNIDEEKCSGCGLCVPSCAEGAIEIIDGKAKLISEIYCDGLGACLGECPEDAIKIEEREANEFDEEKALAHVTRQKKPATTPNESCPGTGASTLAESKPVASGSCPGARAMRLQPADCEGDNHKQHSQLGNWPLQLHLVSPAAPYFKEADILIVADCVPFALPDFHSRYLQGKPVVIGCPKLDDASSYIEKLADIINTAAIKSITVIHMEVPCCLGLMHITEQALNKCTKQVPVSEVTIGIKGDIIKEELRVN